MTAKKNPLPHIFCVGMNHRSAPLKVREAMYARPERIQELLPKISKDYSFSECVILSTCHRFDIYGVTGGDEEENKRAQGLVQDSANFFSELCKDIGESESSVSFCSHTYCHEGKDALEHILSVAASLDSLIIGETQIMAQFKQAWAIAAAANTLGPYMHRLGQESLSFAKRLRTKTEIGRKTVSISHAAIDLAKPALGDLTGRSFFIIGAGEMARIAASYALLYEPKDLFIFNRSVERAEELVAKLGAGKAFALEDLETFLPQADIVVSSTSSQKYVLSSATLQRAISTRPSKPLFLADIAIPRDIDPLCGALEGVILVDLDDLKKVTSQNLKERASSLVQAESMRSEKVEEYMTWLRTFAIKPALSGLKTYLDDLFEREAAKTLNRECFQSMTEEQMKALSGMFSSVISKITADVACSLKNRVENGLFSLQKWDH
ncbi:MAG: glutamyl-tRNA reductase [Oligoflexales bacterium]|nr:glutamyl-tRNA reductase [Oligoflexales bacterium]